MFTKPESLQDLLPIKREPLLYEKQSLIASPGSDSRLFFLHAGVVRGSQFPRGEGHVDFYGPGEFFGRVVPAPEVCCYEALSRCSVSEWSQMEIRLRLLGQDTSLVFASLLAQQEYWRERALWNQRILFHPLKEKFRLLLEDLSVRFGNVSLRDPELIQIPPFTHANLALALGTSREMVTTLMRKYIREDLVLYNRKGIWLSQRIFEGKAKGQAA